MNTSNIDPLVKKLADLYKYYLEDHKATGNLSDFTYDIEFDVKSFRVYFNLESYWKWLEYGRRPGKQPPIEPIYNWIKIKPIIPKAINGKIPSQKQLAFVISKSIGEHGTKAYSPLKKTLSSPEATNIIQEIKTLLIEEINNEIKDVIKPISK
jgi:hypothetical protein